MADYHGDLRLGDTIDLKFTTVNATGVPTSLAGSPVISVYPSNSTTQLTAGITLTVDFDGVTGLHHVRVVASSGNGYATATNYELIITAGTVGGTSVVGYTVGAFSIENRSCLMPTTVGRTLDVSTTGEAGLDWANIGAPTTAVVLSGTTIGVVTLLNSLAAGVITAASIAAAALNGKGDWNIGKTGYALSAAGAQAIWDVLESAIVVASSIGLKVKTNLDAAISSRSTYAGADTSGTTTLLTRIVGTLLTGNHSPQSGDGFARLGAPVGASHSADVAAVKTDTAAVKLKTDNLPSGIQKNTALNNFEFLMVDSTDHVTPKTGLTITATRSLDGAAFAACANAATEVANGIYKINFATTDLNADIVTFRFTGTAADARYVSIVTEP